MRTEDPRLLAHKRRVEAQRRAAAIERRRQQDLRDTAPVTATPATVMAYVTRRSDRATGGA